MPDPRETAARICEGIRQIAIHDEPEHALCEADAWAEAKPKWLHLLMFHYHNGAKDLEGMLGLIKNVYRELLKAGGQKPFKCPTSFLAAWDVLRISLGGKNDCGPAQRAPRRISSVFAAQPIGPLPKGAGFEPPLTTERLNETRSEWRGQTATPAQVSEHMTNIRDILNGQKNTGT